MTAHRALDPSSVYIVSAARGHERGPTKIGITNSINARLSTLRTASPYPLHLIYAFQLGKIALTVEQAAHAALKSARMRGEWFMIEPFKAVEIVKTTVDLIAGAVHVDTIWRADEFLEENYYNPFVYDPFWHSEWGSS